MVRGVLRTLNWWESKLSAVLTVGVGQVAALNLGPSHALGPLLALLLSAIFLAGYAHLVNDLFDIYQDGLADRPNIMAS